MILRKLKGFTRLRLSLGVALCALFVFVASASAVVYVYKNSFGSKSAYNEIDKISGGKKCERSYVKDNKAMRIDMRGKTFCEYSPPVIGDADQPDHEIVADGRILDATPKSVREDAYLAVRVRVGEGTWYEFRVTPKGEKYKFTREPAGGGFRSADQRHREQDQADRQGQQAAPAHHRQRGDGVRERAVGGELQRPESGPGDRPQGGVRPGLDEEGQPGPGRPYLVDQGRRPHPLAQPAIAMATETIERPRTGGPGSGLGGNWQVIVLNDDHNTFDHVASSLARVVPGVSLDAGYRYADQIHNQGRAAVWTGPKEPAELYWEQLSDAGLTMAPLEQH